MSYILNALKRAERERSQGSVPDILTKQQFSEPPTYSLPLAWKAAILALILIAFLSSMAIGWIYFTSQQNTEQVQNKPAQGAGNLPPPATVTEPVSPAPAASESKIPVVTDILEPDFVLEIANLPREIRLQLPEIILSGHVYSELNPTGRSIIVNDRLVSQNEYAAKGLLLKEITPFGVIFAFGGQLFSMRTNEIYR